MQGQRKAEGRSGALVRSRPQTPAMHLDDGAANRQTHSHTVLLRSEERVEYRRGIRYAAAAITDLDQDIDAVAPGNERQDPGPIRHALHCLDPVVRKVDQGVLNLYAIYHDHRQTGR